MKIIILIIGLMLTTMVSGQQMNNNSAKHNLIKKRSDKIFDSLVEIRRDLHMYPEKSGQERRTSKIIEKYLLKLGLEVKTNIGGYGVVGILNGNKKGRKIAWRADIDALESNFADKVDFKSKIEGVGHNCGHDIHTVIGLGIANILAKQKNNIEGIVYFIFQPSEENFKGAESMIDDGLFDLIKPDEIYGVHIVPMQTGLITTKSQEVFSYTRTIRIKFKKETEVDSLKYLAESITQNLSRVKTDSKPWNLQNLFDSKIGLENPETIYQDYLIIQGSSDIKEDIDGIFFDITFNETDRANLDIIPAKIKEQILKTKYKNELLSVKYVMENPTVINDSMLTNAALKTIREIYGAKYIMPDYGQIPFFNDDFAYFQQHLLGVYFLLGGSNFEKGFVSMPHSPDFAVDEKSIKIGVECFSSLILERVNNEKNAN